MARTQGEISLIRGEDRTIPFAFRKKSGAPLDLTNCTAIVATFKNSDNGVSSVTLADGDIEIVSPAGSGLINIILDSVFTDTLADGDRIDFQIDLTISGKVFKFKFQESLKVEESLS
jgi:hypothetical protein